MVLDKEFDDWNLWHLMGVDSFVQINIVHHWVNMGQEWNKMGSTPWAIPLKCLDFIDLVCEDYDVISLDS